MAAQYVLLHQNVVAAREQSHYQRTHHSHDDVDHPNRNLDVFFFISIQNIRHVIEIRSVLTCNGPLKRCFVGFGSLKAAIME